MYQVVLLCPKHNKLESSGAVMSVKLAKTLLLADMVAIDYILVGYVLTQWGIKIVRAKRQDDGRIKVERLWREN